MAIPASSFILRSKGCDWWGSADSTVARGGVRVPWQESRRGNGEKSKRGRGMQGEGRERRKDAGGPTNDGKKYSKA